METTDKLKFMNLFIELCIAYPNCGYLENYELKLKPTVLAYWTSLEKVPFGKIEAAIRSYIEHPITRIPTAHLIELEAGKL